jgi:hypothetical protein
LEKAIFCAANIADIGGAEDEVAHDTEVGVRAGRLVVAGDGVCGVPDFLGGGFFPLEDALGEALKFLFTGFELKGKANGQTCDKSRDRSQGKQQIKPSAVSNPDQSACVRSRPQENAIKKKGLWQKP